MIFMLRCPQVRFCLFATSLVLIVCAFTASGQSGTTSRGRKYKSPPPTARIEVTVLRDVNGKPIENAAVVFHPMEGERDKGSMELKTNEDGKTVIDVLPIGDTVRLQIIAKGFQTYGEDFKVEKSEMAFEIRMKRPGEQYSIYKDHGQSTDAGKDPHGDKPEAGNDEGKAGASPNAPAAPASKDKPAPQPDAQSSPSQSQPPK